MKDFLRDDQAGCQAGGQSGDLSEGKGLVKGVTKKIFRCHGEKKDGRVSGLEFQGPVLPKILA